jgi:hypothetical protein
MDEMGRGQAPRQAMQPGMSFIHRRPLQFQVFSVNFYCIF